MEPSTAAMVVTCPACGKHVGIPGGHTVPPPCDGCGADLSHAMGNVDERTDLDSHTPFGTAVMRRPDIAGGVPSDPDTHPMTDPLTQPLDQTSASAQFEPVPAPRQAAAEAALAATEPKRASAGGLESTLQSRTDSRAAAEQLRARLPQVDVVSTGNEASGSGKGVRWVDSQDAPATVDQTELPPSPPAAAPDAPVELQPAPIFQPPMPPLGTPSGKAGLHWGVWVALLIVVLGILGGVVGALMYGTF